MTQLEQVKKKIERHIKEHKKVLRRKDKTLVTEAMFKGSLDAYEVMLSFIESLEKEQEPKIKGWVARDENGELWFHHLEPMRDGGKWNFGGGGFKMEEDIYPTLSWHDEPIEVELTIREV